MMMCYNFFVGMCSRCSELIQNIDKIPALYYNNICSRDGTARFEACKEAESFDEAVSHTFCKVR